MPLKKKNQKHREGTRHMLVLLGERPIPHILVLLKYQPSMSFYLKYTHTTATNTQKKHLISCDFSHLIIPILRNKGTLIMNSPQFSGAGSEKLGT